MEDLLLTLSLIGVFVAGYLTGLQCSNFAPKHPEKSEVILPPKPPKNNSTGF